MAEMIHELEAALTAAGQTLLSLHDAASASGYNADHLARLVRQGKIPNSGRKGAPAIQAKDLPIRPSTDRRRGERSSEADVEAAAVSAVLASKRRAR